MKKLLITLLMTGCAVISARAQGQLLANADCDGNGSVDRIFIGGNFIRIAGGAGTVSRTYTFPGSISFIPGGIVNMNGNPGVEIAIRQAAPNQHTMRVIKHRAQNVQTYPRLNGHDILAGGIGDFTGDGVADIAGSEVLDAARGNSRIFVLSPIGTGSVRYFTAEFGTVLHQTWSLLSYGADPNTAGLEIDIFVRIPDFRGPAFDAFVHRRIYSGLNVIYTWRYPDYLFYGGIPGTIGAPPSTF